VVRLAAGLGLYFFLDDMYATLIAVQLDFPLAAQGCTSACRQVCAIPPSAFVPIDTNVTAIPWEYPPSLRRKLSSAFQQTLLSPVYQKVHTGPGDVWWCDPRQAPTYCSWSWTEDQYKVSTVLMTRCCRCLSQSMLNQAGLELAAPIQTACTGSKQPCGTLATIPEHGRG
jgi:hypothetical protein